MKKTTALTHLIIISAIVVVVLMISTKLYFRLDFTEDKRYTLSNATKDVVAELEDVVTVKAYFTKDLPPQLVQVREEFENLLKEYEVHAGGNLVYEFINPNENETKEREAQEKGINPIMVTLQEKDQAKQMRAYLGASIQLGEKTEIIPFVQPGGGVEFSLTKAIKKIAVEDKPAVAILQGHGEPSLGAIPQLMEQLAILYSPEAYTLSDTSAIPGYYKALVWIDPQDSVPATHLEKIDEYLTAGGSLFLAYNSLENSLQQPYLAAKPDIGIKSWLGSKGINLQDSYVVDASCYPVSIQQNFGGFTMRQQVQFPFIPMVTTFEEHPVVDGLESMVMAFTAPISYAPTDSAIQYFPLAFSSEMSGVQVPPAYVDIQKEWTEDDFRDPNQLLAIAAEGPLTGSGHSRVVFIGNGPFVTNGQGQQQQAVDEDNINFASNAIDWLADDTGLIDLRTKGINNRPLKQIDDTTRNIYKWGNVFLPVIIVLVIGIVRKQRYNRKKRRWISGNY